MKYRNIGFVRASHYSLIKALSNHRTDPCRKTSEIHSDPLFVTPRLSTVNLKFYPKYLCNGLKESEKWSNLLK